MIRFVASFPLKEGTLDSENAASALDLPEAAALTPLRVPPLTPLRRVSGGVASGSAAAAAVKEAFAHGDEVGQMSPSVLSSGLNSAQWPN